MLILELAGIELDRCDRCGGTWLDTGELGLILERIEGRGASSDALDAALDRAAEGPPTDLRCPRCRVRMREIMVAREPDLRLDRCRKGHGVWCERGEMKALLERFASESAITSFLAGVFPNAGS